MGGERVWIFPSNVPLNDLRPVFNAALRDEQAVPRGWETTKVLLRSRGWTGGSAEQLRLHDPWVAKVIDDAFTATYSISGIAVSPRLYPVAVSITLGALSFALLGPILALSRSERSPLEDSWIMLADASGWRAAVLGAAKALVVAIAMAMPVLVTMTQLRLIPLLPRADAFLLGFASLGPMLASITLLGFAFVVWRMNRRVKMTV